MIELVLCLLMINWIYSEEIYALPQGVRRVEIGNWTKTREVNEIGGDEKKLNTYKFSNVKNINMENDINSIDEIDNLYDKSDMLRTIKIANSQNNRTEENMIKGNKILRIPNHIADKVYGFNYTNIKTWLGSDTLATWKDGFEGSKIITWPCYLEVVNNLVEQENPVEWRMLEGDFYLNSDEIDSIQSGEVQPVIGITTNDDEEFKLICPFNDLLHVFIDGKQTHLNYKTESNNLKYKMNLDKYTYKDTNLESNSKYCDLQEHNNLCSHTNNKHLDTNILNNYKDIKDDTYYKMVGDISSYVNTQNKHTISLLIGQVGRNDWEDTSLYSGGISKLDLFLIQNPKLDIFIRPYVIKNGEKIYTSDNYKFMYNEKILFDIEIENLSSCYDFNNLKLDLSLIKNIKNSGKTIEKSTLEINKNLVTYDGENVTNTVQAYLNNEESNLENLSQLKKGDKLVISSDKFNYTVTEYNSNKEVIPYNYICEFNYLNDYIFYKYENSKKLNVKPVGGTLNIQVNSEEENYFYLKLMSEDNFSNIKVKSNEPYTVCNLDYDKEYKLLLINSSDYKPENIQNFVLTNSSNNKSKSITINAIPKSNHYFTQRKIDEININR